MPKPLFLKRLSDGHGPPKFDFPEFFGSHPNRALEGESDSHHIVGARQPTSPARPASQPISPAQAASHRARGCANIRIPRWKAQTSTAEAPAWKPCLAKCMLSMVEMKVLRVAPFVASTSHVQSPTCAHENAQIHVVFVVGKRHSGKTCFRKSKTRRTRGPWHGVARNLKSNIVIS